ncbi:hypothetical protein Plec18170_007780 [Paecilomyces lecythidis]
MSFCYTRQKNEELDDRIQRLIEMVKQLRESSLRLQAGYERMIRPIERSKDRASGFDDLRHRFLSMFKRDKMNHENPLNTLTLPDNFWISEGNQTVHGGDCRKDAELYYPTGARQDFNVYTELYGFHPGVVRSIAYEPTINLLNAHASILSSQLKPVSPRFRELFRDFVDALAESNYARGYLGDSTSKVTQAYWKFLQCLNEEVTEVEVINTIVRGKTETEGMGQCMY